MQDDGALGRRLLAGLHEAHRTAAVILGSATAADDAVQEAAAQAWSRRRSLRDPGAFDAWFARIVINTCRMELRRRSSRPQVAAVGVPLELVDRSGRDLAADLATRDEVGRVLERLGADERIALALRYGRDLTVPEIAARLGVPEGTVKSRLHDALARTRAALAVERLGPTIETRGDSRGEVLA